MQSLKIANYSTGTQYTRQENKHMLTLLTEAGLWNSNQQINLVSILLLKPNVQRLLKSNAAAALAFGSYA